MFCPRCSQLQAIENMRFCSRCGFPLTIVADLLAHDGALTQIGEKQEDKRLSPRRKGVRQGTMLMFVGLVVGFMMAVLSVFVLGRPELFVPITAGVFFLSGILRIIYAYMFEPSAQETQTAFGPAQLGAAGDYALPPAQSVPVSGLGAQRMNTSEMATRASVTEHTTKLLEKE
jgi:hypothetical protein